MTEPHSLESRLLLALTDPAYRRQLIGRLRPRLVGRPHPQRRLQRMRGPVLRVCRHRVEPIRGQAERAASIEELTMNPATVAALRLLVLALGNHPEDLEALNQYGRMGEHLADLIEDLMDD
jgi:hypothetical protein